MFLNNCIKIEFTNLTAIYFISWTKKLRGNRRFFWKMMIYTLLFWDLVILSYLEKKLKGTLVVFVQEKEQNAMFKGKIDFLCNYFKT